MKTLYYLFLSSLIIIFHLSKQTIFGQVDSQIDEDQIQQKTDQNPSMKYLLGSKESLKQTNNFENEEKKVVNIIVEFKKTPQLILNKKYQTLKSGKLEIKKTYTEQFNKFYKDLEGIQSKMKSTAQSGNTEILVGHEYYKIFNGVNLIVPAAYYDQIEKLSYVKRIHYNTEVHAMLNESVSHIRADSVWHKLGAKGENTVVGIIDTGIDYLHPALGGGYGTGFKVIGGYDFVEDDNDPMDEKGHGTHVAGIVAGNSDSIQGVAPEAKLLAIRVLNAQGGGTTDDIIAGIEWTVDPNDDGMYDDRPDVVNMSLGGSGDPYDAKSQAVNNAVELGIVFCIAAGNSGRNGFQTIRSPGTSMKAITVGASDLNDFIADFSSRGPNVDNYSIKPEVVAPGVDVYSSELNEEYERHSGTSMASPHVAGICALLKQLHPDWSVEEIKSAVVNTAIDIKKDVTEQGAGRIDALKAASIQSTAIPSIINFGRVDIDNISWSTSDTIIITNHSGQSQNYNIEILNASSGVEILSSESSFTLADNESHQLAFSANVDNSILPYNDVPFSNFVHINGTIDTLNIPWSISKPLLLEIISDLRLSIRLFDHKGNGYYTSHFYRKETEGKYIYRTNLPIGNYTLIAFNKDDNHRFFTKGNIDFKSTDSVVVDFAQSTNKIFFKGQDKYGELLANNQIWRRKIMFLVQDSVYEFFEYNENLIATVHLDDTIFCNDFSDNIDILCSELAILDDDSKELYLINYPILDSLKNDKILSNSIIDLHEQKLQFHFPLNSINSIMYHYMTYPHLNTYYGMHTSIKPSKIDTLIRNISLNYNLATHPNYSIYSYFGTGSFQSEDIILFGLLSPFLIAYDNSSIAYDFGEKYPKMNIPAKEDTLKFGDGAIHPRISFYNNSLNIDNIAIEAKFYGQLFDKRPIDIPYSDYLLQLESTETTVSQGSLDEFSQINTQSGKYRFEVFNNNYLVNGIKGVGKYTASFDLLKDDPNPPTITTLQIRNSDTIPVSNLNNGEDASVLLVLTDTSSSEKADYNTDYYQYCLVNHDSTKILIKESDSTEWIEVSHVNLLNDTSINGVYEADISSYTSLDSSALDLKIEAQDSSGNKIVWCLEPAVTIGKMMESVPQLLQTEQDVYYGDRRQREIFVGADTGVLANDQDISQLEAVLVKQVEGDLFGPAADDSVLLYSDGSFLYKVGDTTYNNYRQPSFYYEARSGDKKSFWTRVYMIFMPIEEEEPTNITEYDISSFKLLQNYPNPASKETYFPFVLDGPSEAKLEIYDLSGNLVDYLDLGYRNIGIHTIPYTLNFSEGIYFYMLRTEKEVKVKKMMVVSR